MSIPCQAVMVQPCSDRGIIESPVFFYLYTNTAYDFAKNTIGICQHGLLIRISPHANVNGAMEVTGHLGPPAS